MVNLLDRAFGDGAGVVIAPTVEVAYASDIWHRADSGDSRVSAATRSCMF